MHKKHKGTHNSKSTSLNFEFEKILQNNLLINKK